MAWLSTDGFRCGSRIWTRLATERLLSLKPLSNQEPASEYVSLTLPRPSQESLELRVDLPVAGSDSVTTCVYQNG